MISWYQFTLEQFKQVLWIQQNSQKNNPNELARSKKRDFRFEKSLYRLRTPLKWHESKFYFFLENLGFMVIRTSKINIAN